MEAAAQPAAAVEAVSACVRLASRELSARQSWSQTRARPSAVLGTVAVSGSEWGRSVSHFRAKNVLMWDLIILGFCVCRWQSVHVCRATEEIAVRSSCCVRSRENPAIMVTARGTEGVGRRCACARTDTQETSATRYKVLTPQCREIDG